MFIAYLLAFTPSFVHVLIRRLMGAKIGKGSKISFGTILLSNQIAIGDRVRIGPFVYINASEIKIEADTKIKPLSSISARIIEFGRYVHIAPFAVVTGDHTPRSKFIVGDHSRIFPFCWIDAGEGVELGNHVGVGGRTLIFTHGVWSDFIDGGPVAYGPVKIEDNVWLPWRVFIMPNVTIGKNSIIGANSTITKSIGENVIAAGSPAKKVKDGAMVAMTVENKVERAQNILEKFAEHLEHVHGDTCSLAPAKLTFRKQRILINETESLTEADILVLVGKKISPQLKEELLKSGVSIIFHDTKNAFVSGNDSFCLEFITFLRRYGVRLYLN